MEAREGLLRDLQAGHPERRFRKEVLVTYDIVQHVPYKTIT